MTTDKKYRLIDRTKAGRNIEVVFASMPRKHISTGTKDMAEAILFAEKHLYSIGQGENASVVPLFKDFAKDFFSREDKDSYRFRDRSFKREKREMWYTRQQWYLDKYIMDYFGSYPLNTITTVLIEKWMISLQGTIVKDLSGNSKKKTLNTLRMVLDDAARALYIQVNPARLATIPKEIPVNPKRTLTIYEQRTLFSEDKSKRIAIWGSTMYAGFFSVMYDTGFRPAEVAALKVEDVYTTPKGMGVYTDHSICFETKKFQEKVKTTGKGLESRVGLLSAVTGDIIKKLIKDAKLKDGDFLFLVDRARKDSWVQSATANKRLRAVCTELGLNTDISQYSLRHTYATYRRGNLDEATLALSMGHSGGKVRDDYDHRTAQILLMQLEKERDKLFKTEDESTSVTPLSKKMG